MILRQPPVTDQPLKLRTAAVRNPIPMHPSTEVSMEADSPLRLLVPVTTEGVIAKESFTPEPSLTFENVVAWLAVQDADTRQSCGAILANEVTQVYEQARAEGFNAGRMEAITHANAQLEQQLGVIKHLADSAQMAFDKELGLLEHQCAEIVGEAFAKIAGETLANPAAIVGTVREVLKRVRDGKEIQVRVPREHLDLLRANEAALADALAGRKVEFVVDARIELGGCIVETKSGSLDGRLEIQLRELHETLRLARVGASAGIT